MGFTLSSIIFNVFIAKANSFNKTNLHASLKNYINIKIKILIHNKYRMHNSE